ncbi:MAG: thioredoxin family protein, partial [Rhodocyclaceae bacterium]|nr:thioredoxin family protein [Rhodocyclaceae bacterium]
MLENSLKEQLQALFVNLRETVQITPFVDDSEASEEMLGYLRDVAAQSERVELLAAQRDAAGERVPSFALANAAGDSGIRFAGIPGGHEFSSLVLAILQSGGHPPKVDDDTIAQIRGLSGDFQFETFVSLSCHNCPDVVQALNLLAVLNPGIRHTMIDGALFQDEVERREIMGVPSVFLNGAPFGQGRMELGEILNKIDTGATERAAERLNEMAPFDVLVIGGGPAGVAAAIYCARKGIRTGIIAERIG